MSSRIFYDIDGPVLKIIGDIDLPMASKLSEVAVGIVLCHGKIVFDLSKADHIGSVVLGVITRAAKAVEIQGGSLHDVVIRGPHPQAMRVLSILNLEKHLKIEK